MNILRTDACAFVAQNIQYVTKDDGNRTTNFSYTVYTSNASPVRFNFRSEQERDDQYDKFVKLLIESC